MTIHSNDHRLRAFYELLPSAIGFSKDGMMVDANPAYLNLFGYNHIDEIAGKSILDQIAAECRADIIDRIKLRTTGGSVPDEYETIGLKKDGTKFHFRINVTRAEFVNDGPLTMVLIRDISKQVETETELKAAMDLQYHLTSASPVCIAAYKESGQCIYANEAAAKMVGTTVQNLLQQNFKHIKSWQESGILTAAEKALAGQPNKSDFNFVSSFGRSTWATFYFTSFQQSGQKHLLLIADDVTDHIIDKTELMKYQNQLEKLVAARTNELSILNRKLLNEIRQREKTEQEMVRIQKFESLGLLAGGIAHDFNNVLTAIQSNIQLAMDQGPLTSHAKERLQAATKAVQRAAEIAKQLLSFSKTEKPVTKLTRLEKCIRQAAELALRGSKNECTFKIANDLFAVEVDEGQIFQVINNLVINADQAMPKGGSILIQAQNIFVQKQSDIPLPQGKYVQITIQDNGIGIQKELLSKIFDPYFTTKPNGNGLGLATSFSIVRKHNGHMQASSMPDVGSIFKIILPASTKELSTQSTSENETEFRSGKILVMDDDPSIREVLVLGLGFRGYKVDAASDGLEAIELYKREMQTGNPYGCIILDLTIPGGMGGRETLQTIRQFDPSVNAIIVTGYNDTVFPECDFNEGLVGIVPKPFSIDDLSKTIQRTLLSSHSGQ